MSKRLFVGNLPYAADDEALQAVFIQVGPVTSAKVVVDKHSGRSKGFGFVEMTHDEDLAKAITQFHGAEWEGRIISVAEAKGTDRAAAGASTPAASAEAPAANTEST